MEECYFNMIRNLNLDGPTEAKVIEIFTFVIRDFNGRFILLEKALSSFHQNSFNHLIDKLVENYKE